MNICMKINGLKKIKKKIIKNSKGDILKFLLKSDSYFKGFGEIYFTEIKKNKVKGWNCHKKFFCLLAVPLGKVNFFFIDGRRKSKSYLKEEKIYVNKNNYNIILVPPGVWFSFKSFAKLSIVANCINHPHSDKESVKSSNIKGYKIKN